MDTKRPNAIPKGDFAMRTKQALLALSTAIMLLGSGSLVLANEPTDEYGGYKVGPQGQIFSNGPVERGWNTYGFVAPSQTKHTTHKHTARPAYK